MQGYSCDLSKIYFPWLGRSMKTWVACNFLWFLMLMSLHFAGMTGVSPQMKFGSDQRDRLWCCYTAPWFRPLNSNSLWCVTGYFCEVCCQWKWRNEEEDYIFQIRLFSITSLFQKSQTTQCIMVTWCSELLQLLNGSSLPSPQNCFIVVLKLCLSCWVGCWVICFLNLPFTMK